MKLFRLLSFGLLAAVAILAPVSLAVTANGPRLVPAVAHGACSPDVQLPGCPINPPGSGNSGGGDPLRNQTGGCAGVAVALPILAGGSTCVANNPATGGAIMVYLKEFLVLVGGVIGLIVIIVITYGGIEYITAASDPGRVKNAKNRIQNAIIALVLYLLTYAILQFIVPGGLFI